MDEVAGKTKKREREEEEAKELGATAEDILGIKLEDEYTEEVKAFFENIESLRRKLLRQAQEVHEAVEKGLADNKAAQLRK